MSYNPIIMLNPNAPSKSHLIREKYGNGKSGKTLQAIANEFGVSVPLVSQALKSNQDPKTPEEWHYAVDSAQALLVVDALRHHGLVEGGPEVHVRRCESIVRRGAKRGIHPDGEEVTEILRALADQDLLDSIEDQSLPVLK